MKKILAIILMLLPLLTYSQSSTNYDNWIYNGDKSISEYTIPDGVRAIGNEAFMNCENLMTITIPESVTSIGESAFEYCKSLKSIFIPKNVKEIKVCAFGSCYQLQKFEVDKENKYFTTVDGVLFNYDKTKLVSSPNLKSYAVPQGTKIIGEFAFQGCIDLASISIPGSVESIERYALSICNSLTTVTIPGNVKKIGEYTFWRCENLKSVIFENGVETIGSHSFYKCYNLKSITIPESVNDAESLNYLSGWHYNSGNYTEAIKLSTQALEIRKKVLGEEHPYYAQSLNNLASYYDDIGNYTEAIRLGTQALEICKKVLGEEHPDYATSLNNLASYNYSIGNYPEAIRLCTQAMEIRKRVLGEEHPDYATSLSNLAQINSSICNYPEAIRLGTQAMEIRKRVLGEEHPNFATSLSNLATYNSSIGNYTEAIRLCTQALEIRRKVLGDEHPDYAISLGNLAYYNLSIGNYTEAIRLGTQALEIRRKVLGEEHHYYALSLNNLATYNSSIGNYTEAIRLCTQASEIFRKVLGEEHPFYANSLNNLASDNSKIGNYTEAIRLCTQALEIRRKALGEEHPDYAQSLNNLAYYNFEAGNYDKSAKLYKQCFEHRKTFILKNFASMTEKERANFWSIDSWFFSDRLPYCAYKHPTPTFATLAYNGQLLSKGLLLNAELEIQKLIEKSGDKEMEQRFYKIRSDREMLDKLYQIAPSKRQMSVDSLLTVIDNEERLLVESSKELGDYTRNLSICWEDVQKQLSKNDIAIEFAKASSYSNNYVALVLKKGISVPEIVNISFSEDDLANCYTNSNLYNAIWKPLEKYLNGVENVYFAPSGKFYNVGIEYLPDDSGEIFANKYNAYRLSSTRELALPHIVNPNKNAAVYGGLVYNFGRGDWQDLVDYQDEIAMETSFRDLPDISEDQRAGITFLQGAKIESDEIVNILRNNHYLVSQGTGVLGTETNFKKLSGSGVKILHIATHGFFEPENKEQKMTDFLMTNDKSNKEDNSLSRSGLFLAGANSALDPKKRKEIPEGFDDGILTAKEISRLDFKGLDLVVLSACQTGLGEVTSEGVFGLQRGFKKAGAQTIVMSLWKVDDNATKDLMTEFYKNLVSGKSKREAFISAQEFLRNKYNDPHKWAAFVMVDGF